MITALITSRNNPRVIIVTGRVKSTKIGFTMRFKSANTIATIIAVPYPATLTPGKNCDNKITATAVSNILRMNFIIILFELIRNKIAKKTPEKFRRFNNLRFNYN